MFSNNRPTDFLLVILSFLLHIQSTVSQSICTPCIPTKGSYLTSTGFDLCRAGTIGSQPPSSFCTNCPSGKSSYQGAVECSNCLPGFYAPTPHTPVCVACDRNSRQYQDEIGSSKYKQCKHGEQSTGETAAC